MSRRCSKMIYSRLANIYGHLTTEEILLHAMSLLGRLPHSYFAFRAREACPRVSCQFSMVWFSYLKNWDKNMVEDFAPNFEEGELFTVQLLTDQQLSLIEFHSSSVEGIAIEVERHERKMRAKRTQILFDDQLGDDTGVARTIRRLC